MTSNFLKAIAYKIRINIDFYRFSLDFMSQIISKCEVTQNLSFFTLLVARCIYTLRGIRVSIVRNTSEIVKFAHEVNKNEF